MLLSAAVAVLMADQATKSLAVALFPGRQAPPRFFVLRCISNEHGCGGSRLSPATMVVLWTAEAAMLIALVESGVLFTSWWAQAALGAALGGAAGNLSDRLWRRGVVDFIDLRIWPVFNLGDAAIVVGAAAAAVSVL